MKQPVNSLLAEGGEEITYAVITEQQTKLSNDFSAV